MQVKHRSIWVRSKRWETLHNFLYLVTELIQFWK